MTYLITITEPIPDDDESRIEHYRRRVEIEDLNLVIQRLDQSLNVRVRRTRSDKGQARTEGGK